LWTWTVGAQRLVQRLRIDRRPTRARPVGRDRESVIGRDRRREAVEAVDPDRKVRWQGLIGEFGEGHADRRRVPGSRVGQLDRDIHPRGLGCGTARLELCDHILLEDLARARQRKSVADGEGVEPERVEVCRGDEGDDASVDLEAARDRRSDREEGPHGIGGHAGLVERDLDAGVDGDIGRLVAGQGADDAERPGGRHAPGSGHGAVGATESESVGRARRQRGGGTQDDRVAGRGIRMQRECGLYRDGCRERSDRARVEAAHAERGIDGSSGDAGLRRLE